MAVEKKVFARKASGLVRQLTWYDGLMLGIAGVSLGMMHLYFAWIPGNYPGSNMYLFFTIAAFFTLTYYLLFAQFSSAMPRSGGDYILVSRTFGSAIGFMENWTKMLAGALVMGGMIAAVTGPISSLFWDLGLIYNNPKWLIFAVRLWDPDWMLILGTIALFLIFALMVLPTKLSVKWLLSIFMALGVAVVLITWLLGFFSSAEVFKQNWNQLVSPYGFTDYDQVPALAEKLGLSYNFKNWLPLTIGASFMAFWAYGGGQSVSYVAGEVKEASKSMLIAILGSLIMTFLLYISGSYIWENVMGYKFLASSGYLFQFHLDEWGMLPPEIMGYGFVLFPNPVWAVIQAISAFGWGLFLNWGIVFTMSRCMFAWSFDRILPDRVSYVHPKWRTPVIASAITVILGWGGLLFSLSPWGLWMMNMNANFIMISTLCVIALAGIFFPLKRKDIFDAAPGWVRFKIGRIPFMSIWSAITLITGAGMLYTTITMPAVGGFIGLGTWVTTVGLFVLGGIVYAISRWYRRKKEGVDISLASKEIPPV